MEAKYVTILWWYLPYIGLESVTGVHVFPHPEAPCLLLPHTILLFYLKIQFRRKSYSMFAKKKIQKCERYKKIVFLGSFFFFSVSCVLFAELPDLNSYFFTKFENFDIIPSSFFSFYLSFKDYIYTFVGTHKVFLLTIVLFPRIFLSFILDSLCYSIFKFINIFF